MVKKIRLIILTLLTSVLLLTANGVQGQQTAPVVSEDLAHKLAISTLTPNARTAWHAIRPRADAAS